MEETSKQLEDLGLMLVAHTNSFERLLGRIKLGLVVHSRADPTEM